MGKIILSLIWAGAILAAALISAANDLSDGATFGIIMGLTGAAWSSLYADTPCGRGCLQ